MCWLHSLRIAHSIPLYNMLQIESSKLVLGYVVLTWRLDEPNGKLYDKFLVGLSSHFCGPLLMTFLVFFGTYVIISYL